MQGRSFWRDLIKQQTLPPVEGMYYRYWENDDLIHKAPAHYGYRTDRYKIIYYYNDGAGARGSGFYTYPPEWELYDLQADPAELNNVYDDPTFLEVREQLKTAMWREQSRLGDAPHPSQPRPANVEDVTTAEAPEQASQSFLELVGLHQPE
jgi:arylsulfatase A-like enzyme